MLQPTRTALRQISFDSLVDAKSLPERLASIYALSEELRANRLLSALYIGEADGDFLLARPLPAEGSLSRELEAPESAAFLAQSITQGAGHFHFLRADGSLLAERAEPEYRFEARERPWYRLAQQQTAGRQGLAPPYGFFTTQELGITLSQRSRHGRGTVGLDLVLEDLSRNAGRVARQPRRLAAPGRCLAAAELQRAQASAATHRRSGLAAAPERAERAGDRDWVRIRLPLSLGPGMELQLLQASPLDELVAPARQRAQRVTLLALGLALLLPVGWVAGACSACATTRGASRASTSASPSSVARACARCTS